MGRHKKTEIAPAKVLEAVPSLPRVNEVIKHEAPTQDEKTDALRADLERIEGGASVTDGGAPASADGGAPDAEERPRRKYKKRRPKDAEPEEPTAPLMDAEQLASMKNSFKMLSGSLWRMFFRNLPQDEQPTEAEIEMFAVTIGPIMDKYAPRAAQYAPELAMAGAALAIILPRMGAIIERLRNAKAPKSGADIRADGQREELPRETAAA